MGLCCLSANNKAAKQNANTVTPTAEEVPSSLPTVPVYEGDARRDIAAAVADKKERSGPAAVAVNT